VEKRFFIAGVYFQCHPPMLLAAAVSAQFNAGKPGI
jgi:hypothetical protein